MCTQHENEIAPFYEHILNALIKAGKECIPRNNCGRAKKTLCRVGMFVSRGKCYHQARKMVIKEEELMTTEKLAESLQAGVSSRQFWRTVRTKGKLKKK